MVKPIPENFKGDRVLVYYASGCTETGPLHLMPPTRESPFTGDKTVQLRIEGIHQIIMNALSLYLSQKEREGIEVTEESIIEAMYPPAGEIYKLVRLWSDQPNSVLEVK
jgi:hypothetical protein